MSVTWHQSPVHAVTAHEVTDDHFDNIRAPAPEGTLPYPPFVSCTPFLVVLLWRIAVRVVASPDPLNPRNHEHTNPEEKVAHRYGRETAAFSTSTG